MAEWRKKAYAMFGFKRGDYSSRWGVASLFSDLYEMAIKATDEGDRERLDRIFEYALWADGQNAENLRSAADINFFMPSLRHTGLAEEAEHRLTPELMEEKRSLLIEAG
ncbi:MAG: hypothetical protein GC164_11525 [Phycisphaera sp.]|nr:hypothetical protein [Phycisphaera sp.]